MMRSKKVSYVVHAADIQMLSCGGRRIAGVWRFGKQITAFVPSEAQLAKIRKGRGNLNVTEGSIARARVLCGRR